MPLNPSDLRELADRLESEAATAQEEREAERIQAALESGQEALAERITERLLERMGDRLEQAFEARYAVEEEDDGGEGESDNGEEEGVQEPDEGGEGHGDILPGRWQSRKVFGAKIYSGPAEPETVRYRNEKGQLQSRPGRVPGRPYQVEWDEIAEPEPDPEAEPAGEEAAA